MNGGFSRYTNGPTGLRSGPPRRRRSGAWGGVALAVLAVLGLAVGATVCSAYAKEKQATVMVTDKERVCGSDADGRTTCKYLLFTDGGTYRVTDSVLVGRWTSSDFYGQVKRCHRYELTYYGFRFGPTSSYPNVKDAKDLGRVEGCEG